MRKPQPSLQWVQDCQQAEAEFARELPRLNELRHRIVREKGECQWRPEYAYKLIELHDWCLKNQPRTILELGSGFTTVVLSHYAAEFGARLVTVEEDQTWLAQVLLWIPDWARQGVHISVSVLDGGGIRYRSLPDLGPTLETIDLLYVDGPAVRGPPLACLDAVKLVETVQVRNLLFDMRHLSVDEFRAVKGYGFEPGGTYDWACADYLRPRKHHSWFWRK